ncbi:MULTISPECIES: metal ABC transporter ATP-binding protein [Staphylococcus]|uniref:Metal ABC transporter ATP-binding protein n=1 Tax=Staphylococcus hsinchuensis TaxID=3051183 RepID=A0ABZ3EGK5_9STAP
MLSIKNLNLTLGVKHVLHNVTLNIPIQGEIIGVFGPNGAGKSSLFKSIIGEFKYSGQINYQNKPITNHLKAITYIPQKSQIDLDFPIDVTNVIISGSYKNIGWFKKKGHETKDKLNELLKKMELEDLRHRQISQLSGGQLQRVLIARALMSESDIYLLDEPFVGVDFRSEQIIMTQLKQLKEAGKLLLIVHHDLSSAETYFDRIILINKTVKFFGDSKQAMEPEQINSVFLSANKETKGSYA